MFSTKNISALEQKDVGIGTLVWYKGFTSQSSWDCPAVIYHVSRDRKSFQVMSLDDMRRQDQEYDVDMSERSPNSRSNMRIASVAEVDAYLKARKSGKTARDIIAEVQFSR